MATFVKALDSTAPDYPYGPICNSCNGDIRLIGDKKAWAVYLSKTDLKANRPYDVYCSNDVGSWTKRGATIVP